MKCDITIHKKPVGNHRPKVEIELHICARDYPHRPRLKGLEIIGAPGNLYQYVRSNAPHVSIHNLAFDEDACIFNSPKRSSTLVKHRSIGTTDKYGAYTYAPLFAPQYLDGDINEQIIFYLPFRKNPDYSDVARLFAGIPKMIKEQLKDGMNYGESQEIKINSMGVINNARPAINKTQRRKIRI